MNERFHKIETPLDGAFLIKRKPILDLRGSFERLYCEKEFSSFGWANGIKQINRTITREKGSIRGMHFQQPMAEFKLVTCVKGKIWDVIVDLRKDSPTFLKWHAEVLSQDEESSFLIPKGFAHGFQSLDKDCELIYLHSEFYSPQNEKGLRYDDNILDIKWPLDVSFCSERDKQHKLLTEYKFEGIDNEM